MKRNDKQSIERYQKQLELVASCHALNPFETAKERKEAIDRAKNDFAYMVQRYFPHYVTAKTPDFHISFTKKVKKDKTFKGFAEWGRALSKSVVNNILLPFGCGLMTNPFIWF